MNKLLFTSLFALLGGCVSTDNPTADWVSYYNKAGTPAKKMRFMELVSPTKQSAQQFAQAGSFYIEGEREINVFQYDKDKKFALVNADTNTPIDKTDKDTFQQLGQAKSIRFYEFGRGLIEIADYQSTTGICQDFFSPNGVTVDFTTNYHVPNDDGVLVSFANAKLIAQTGSQVTTASVANYLTGNNSEQEMKKFAQYQRQLVNADANKLGRFLFVICRQK